MSKNNFYKNGLCPNIFLGMLLVPLVFVVVLTVSYLGYIHLDISLKTLLTVIFILVVFLFFIPHNASYASCRISKNFLLMEEDFQSSLKKNALTIMGKTKSTLTVRDFVEEYFKNVRDDNYAKVASSIFPMLGILGTFLAIALSMPDFTVSDSEKLDQQISLLLSGIGTAFYASIFGIFLSLWWIFFERMGLTNIERSIQALEALYNERIWSRSELVKHEHMENELKDQKIIEALKETFNIDFIKDMNMQYMRNYQRIIEDSNRSFALIAQKMQDGSQDLRQTLERLEERKRGIKAEEAINRNMERFIQSSQRLEDSLEHFDNSLGHTLEKIDFELASAVERLGRMLELIAKEQERMIKRTSSSRKNNISTTFKGDD